MKGGISFPLDAVGWWLRYTAPTPTVISPRSMLSEDTAADEITRKRLYWHSRRGMWELDLLLIPFLERRYDSLGSADQAAFQALIDEEDQDLFMWLMRREWPQEPARRRIVKMIVEYAENTDNDQYRTL